MASALLIKSGRFCMMPNLLAKHCRLFRDNQCNLNLSLKTQKSNTRLMQKNLNLSNHQVFINYRGDQLRYNFISHLTDAFERHGIKFFVDKDEQRGKDLKHLFVRIEESRIALAIFSTRYSESKWCMNELVKMKKRSEEGKLHVIPIFYKVDVSHVKKLTCESEFGRNFWRFMESSDRKDPIQKWREALEYISNKMGLSLGDNRSEADFVKEIVKEVQRVIQAIELEEE